MALLLFVMGGAAASVWVPMVAVVQKAIGPQHQGKVLGLMSSGTAYGVFVNGMAIPVLLPLGGWRMVWLFVAALTALLVVWGFVRLRSPSEKHSATALPQHSGPGLRDLVRQSLPRKVLILMFLSGLACMPTQNYLTAWMREELGYGVAQAGTAWSVIGIMGMVGGFAFGALADRISVRRALVLAFATLALSVLAFLWHPGVAAMYVGAALFGLSFNAIFGLVPAFVSLSFSPDWTTRVFAWSNVLLGLGSMLGNLLGGVVRDVLHSFAPLYVTALVLAVLLVALALSLVPGGVRFTGSGSPEIWKH